MAEILQPNPFTLDAIINAAMSQTQTSETPELPVELCEDVLAHLVKIEAKLEAGRRQLQRLQIIWRFKLKNSSQDEDEAAPPRLYTILSVLRVPPRPSLTKLALADGVKPNSCNLALAGSLRGLQLLHQHGHTQGLDDKCFWIAAICGHEPIIRWWIEEELPMDASLETQEDKKDGLMALRRFDGYGEGDDIDAEYWDYTEGDDGEDLVDEEEWKRDFLYSGVTSATDWLIFRKAAILERFAAAGIVLSPSLARVLGKSRLKGDKERTWLASTCYVDHHGTLGILQAASQLGCTCVLDAFQEKRRNVMHDVDIVDMLAVGDMVTRAKEDRWPEVANWWADWVMTVCS